MADQDEGGGDSAQEGDDSTATSSADTKDEADTEDEADTAEESDDSEKGSDDSDKATESEGGFDVEAQQKRLDGVEEQIEEGRRALSDLEEESEPEPDGPPVAEDEGAANAPPG